MDKPALNDFPIHDLLKRRWSPRAFAPRSVEPQKLASLLEAARWAPSSRNEQPWSFIVALRDDAAAFQRLAGCLVPGNVTWAQHAGALLLSVAKQKFDHNGKPNPHAWYDVGQATACLVLEAGELGLYAHQMAGYDPAKARTDCGIPEGYDPVAMIAVGYYGDISSLPENLKAGEAAARGRKSIREFAFRGTFGTPLDLPKP